MNIAVDTEKWDNNPLSIQILHFPRSTPCLAGHPSPSLPTLHVLHRYITTIDDKGEDSHAAVSPSSLFPRNGVSWINIPLCSSNEEWTHNRVDKGGILLPNPNTPAGGGRPAPLQSFSLLSLLMLIYSHTAGRATGKLISYPQPCITWPWHHLKCLESSSDV